MECLKMIPLTNIIDPHKSYDPGGLSDGNTSSSQSPSPNRILTPHPPACPKTTQHVRSTITVPALPALTVTESPVRLCFRPKNLDPTTLKVLMTAEEVFAQQLLLGPLFPETLITLET